MPKGFHKGWIEFLLTRLGSNSILGKVIDTEIDYHSLKRQIELRRCVLFWRGGGGVVGELKFLKSETESKMLKYFIRG